jgi:hypothetical protein
LFSSIKYKGLKSPDFSSRILFGRYVNEKKLKTMEEKAPNALEMAEKTNEERKEKKSSEIIRFIYEKLFQEISAPTFCS